MSQGRVSHGVARRSKKKKMRIDSKKKPVGNRAARTAGQRASLATVRSIKLPADQFFPDPLLPVTKFRFVWFCFWNKLQSARQFLRKFVTVNSSMVA